MLPSKGWASYEDDLRNLGERRSGGDERAIAFLVSLGLVLANEHGLSPVGERYFYHRFIAGDTAEARHVLRRQLLTSCAEVASICQTLANRPRVGRAVAETVLRSQGYGGELTDRRLGSLLALMAYAEIIDYSKRGGSFRVVAKPLVETALPDSIFIAPDTPWSNRRWLTRVLGECHKFVYWLDKHFLPEGLDFIGEAADGAQISTVRVISLALDENRTRKAKRAYRDLARELRERSISFEWRFIDSRQLRDTHDRWIITDARAWNVPNLSAILSGQHSELVTSGNVAKLRSVFDAAWVKAPERRAESSDSVPA